MTNKYIVISLDDPKSRSVSEVLNNKTCKKIIDYLSEESDSKTESEISKAIKAPLNTVGYNMKKLLHTGLIKKAKSFFWSSKGKRIPSYKISNKSILISPKKKSLTNKITTSLITLFASVVVGVFIRQFFKPQAMILENSVLEAGDYAAGAAKFAVEESASTASGAVNVINSVSPWHYITGLPVWVWFIAGSLFALIIFLFLNWRKL